MNEQMKEVQGTTDNPVTEESQPLEPAVEQTVNWDDVNDALDVAEVEGDVEVLEVPAAQVAEVVAPAVAAEVAPVVPQYVAPTAPQPTPQQLAAQRAADLTKLEDLYKLSEEESAAMFTEPEKVLPKLLAKMHQQATQSVLDSMQTAVPQIVQRTESATRVETEARQAFFSVNSDLAKPEYEAAVLQVGAMFRQVNPKATKEVAVQKIGELARVALNLPPKAAVAAAEPAAVQTSKPFTPSRGGTGGRGAAGPKGTWEQLNAEFDETDGY